MSFYDQSPLKARIGDSRLARRLQDAIEGEVLFDAFDRGRYSTDASIYQVEPIGVVIPRTEEDLSKIIAVAADEGVPILPRGAGTSQSGQTVGLALVVDVSKHLNKIVKLDVDSRTVTVEPGIVLDQLNAQLRSHGLFFPVDVSTASRATIGGMTGNNSCGARSIRYGLMRSNVQAIDALLASGERASFGPLPTDAELADGPEEYRRLVRSMMTLAKRESDEIIRRFPKIHRRVGGYNIDALLQQQPSGPPLNMAELLVGSEGTLAFSTRISLQLQRVPSHKVVGVCHFPTFYQAMDVTQHIVKLNPDAVELVDRTLIELAKDIAVFRDTLDSFIRGTPDAVLLVEFAGEDMALLQNQLSQLVALMGDLGFPDSVVEITDPVMQRAVWELRKAGLNIMMSMKGDGKPVSFIEDCAVPLDNLAEYTHRLTDVFHRHGTTGTWYAHASEGCLHVRPILNMKTGEDVQKMRSIAEEAFAMVREYKGSHSGEHGDGIVRSEFHEPMFGESMVRIFNEVKQTFDPAGLFNPGKIVKPPQMDDRSLFRYQPTYAIGNTNTQLDWSAWGGFSGAIEMCNNNGACRKIDASVMCPSYRATGDEQHSTRGRANSLRLAVSGQLGPDALSSNEMVETMALCVGCKACRRECPTGVDMARMKIEVQAHRNQKTGLSVRDRLIAYLPRYANKVAPIAPLFNGIVSAPGVARILEKSVGFSRHRPLPRWRPDSNLNAIRSTGAADGPEVVVLLDTFTRWFEPENGHALINVLRTSGCRVHVAHVDQERPLCCGRTFLAAGLLDEAKAEARRLLTVLAPYFERDIPLIGLEPSCLLTLRDEYAALLPNEVMGSMTDRALLLEEFLVRNLNRLHLDLQPMAIKHAALHGHCHQKAFATMDDLKACLDMIPELQTQVIQSSCCGMAGAFGQQAETYDLSMDMAELSLLPTVRELPVDCSVVASGTSCRQQIHHGSGRIAHHFVHLMQQSLCRQIQ